MRAAPTPLEVNLNPSKILFLVRLGLALAVGITLIALPIVAHARLLAFALLAWTTVLWVREWLVEWRRSKPEVLRFYPGTGHWRIDDGEDLQLKPDQFVTRSLVILYCKSAGGKSLTKVIPQDAMTVEHHRQLRQRLMLPASLAEGQH